ncbi:lipoate--protein ligase family protein [bacterium]|nr:lipoate--protein ligase family protein [bacterium]
MGKIVKWRLIRSGHLNGYINMAVDEAMFTCNMSQNTSAPTTLRLYGWNPPAISIGYFQKTEDIKLDKKIDVVRRMTGGGAILHDRELTFSLIAPIKNSSIPEKVSDSYNVICQAIVNGLAFLGINAQIRGKVKTSLSKNHQPFFCFNSPSPSDVVFKNKKLVGSAQRRKNGTLMHHGSILLDDQNLNGAISINTILGREIKFEEISNAVIQGFEKEFSTKLVPANLTCDEIALSRRLEKTKRLNI